jgi:hypothetical protein
MSIVTMLPCFKNTLAYFAMVESIDHKLIIAGTIHVIIPTVYPIDDYLSTNYVAQYTTLKCLITLTPGACTIKLFTAVIYDFRNKLEYLYLASLSSLV